MQYYSGVRILHMAVSGDLIRRFHWLPLNCTYSRRMDPWLTVITVLNGSLRQYEMSLHDSHNTSACYHNQTIYHLWACGNSISSTSRGAHSSDAGGEGGGCVTIYTIVQWNFSSDRGVHSVSTSGARPCIL